MKKFQRIAVSALALLLAGATFPACKGSSTSKDPKTINVKMLKAGFGDSWAYSLKSAFEKAYEAEGYKVNIIAPSNDMEGSVVLNDLFMGYKRTNVDLYITGNIQAAQVGTFNSYDEGNALVEETEELVYKQKAIGYDGQPEEKTVEEKLGAVQAEWVKDTESYNSDKKYYGVPYLASNAGLVVNTAKLATYGYEETPRTSDEVIEMSTTIYTGKKGGTGEKVAESAENGGEYPFTYFNNEYNAGGYGITWMYSMIAQYDYEVFQQLITYTKYDEATKTRVDLGEDGYEIYNDDAITKAFEFMSFVYDPVIASDGSTTQTMDKGQAAMMRPGGAVFMANGDWMLNEVRLNYRNQLNDITFVNYPVNSAIGYEEFASADDPDAILSYVIKLVDENKSVDDIIAAVKADKNYDVTKKSVQRVADARGLHYSRGIESQCFITKGSTKKDIAALFLRMMASDDCAKTIAEEANGTSMYANTVNENAKYDFVKQASKLSVNEYAKPYRFFSNGLRKKMGIGTMFPKEGSNFLYLIYKAPTHTVFDAEKGTLKSNASWDVYAEKAAELQKDEYDNVKKNWATWLKDAKK